jgi:Na+/proline symporter
LRGIGRPLGSALLLLLLLLLLPLLLLLLLLLPLLPLPPSCCCDGRTQDAIYPAFTKALYPVSSRSPR